MSPNSPRTQPSGITIHSGHTGRRRHAAPHATPHWVRRAGLVGGVVSALALCGAAAPAMAENPHDTAAGSAPAARTATGLADTVPLSTSASAQQAVAALQQEALAATLAADKEQAADAARKKAAALHKAARRKAAAAAAAAKAAREQAAQAASRSTARAPLAAASAPAAAATAAAPASSSKVDQLIAFLKAQLGKPYVYGATGPGSYDCSGLTQAAFASIGVDIPRTSQDQSTIGTPVSTSALQPGDLIFWGGEGSAYHVGVFIGGGQYLDAANPSTPVAIHQLADYEPDWAVRVL